MEMTKVPEAGYQIIGLWISGLQRKLTFKNLMFPIKLMSSLIKANNIVSKFKPHLVIGTGGFASGPVLKMAARKGIPYVLQEQNSYAGITNKLLANKASIICVAYDEMDQFFPKERTVLTGNPVRSVLVNNTMSRTEACNFFELDADRKTLLVLGGSLGAKAINELVENKLEFFETLGLQLIWQCGKLYYDSFKKYNSEHIKVYDFLNRMDLAYTAANFIISRAGASSISELCLVGKPVVFIPSPHVAEDHQTKNAIALVNKDAALMVKESDLARDFETSFRNLFISEEDQLRMSEQIKSLALPKATQHIVDEIENLLKAK
jgi:UDP-N-acetylglucosamine--N-acetylmuramyl-(pentapeptide) pyrophosphoryl-undecaprenol N-acetylglucosamine transferase